MDTGNLYSRYFSFWQKILKFGHFNLIIFKITSEWMTGCSKLIEMVTPLIKKKDTNMWQSIPVEERLAVTLLPRNWKTIPRLKIFNNNNSKHNQWNNYWNLWSYSRSAERLYSGLNYLCWPVYFIHISVSVCNSVLAVILLIEIWKIRCSA
jgi:hypothetical protein